MINLLIVFLVEFVFSIFFSPQNGIIMFSDVNVKQNFTSLGNDFFTLYGKQIFTSYGKEFFTRVGKQFFT